MCVDLDYRRFFVLFVEFGKLFGFFFLFVFTVQLRGGGYREGGVCMAQFGACACVACWPTVGACLARCPTVGGVIYHGVSTPAVHNNGASNFINVGCSIQGVAHSSDRFALLSISSIGFETCPVYSVDFVSLDLLISPCPVYSDDCFTPFVDFAFIVDGAPWGCICPFVPEHMIVQFCLSGGLIRQDGGPLCALGVCTVSLDCCGTNFMSFDMCAIVFASPSIGFDFISYMQSRDRRAWPWLVASKDLLSMMIRLGPDTNIGPNTNIKINLKIQYYISHSLFNILINSPLYFPPRRMNIFTSNGRRHAFLVKLLLLLSGNIHPHPGPITRSQAARINTALEVVPVLHAAASAVVPVLPVARRRRGRPAAAHGLCVAPRLPVNSQGGVACNHRPGVVGGGRLRHVTSLVRLF